MLCALDFPVVLDDPTPVHDAGVRLRVNGIVEESITDGLGLRYVVFTQGCPHACRGCHNPETHDLAGGYILSVGEILAQYDANPILTGITFSGGEPFLQADALCQLARQIKVRGGNITVYTGYTLEVLCTCSSGSPEALCTRVLNDPAIAELLDLTDMLVDGPYIEALRDLTLTFRGSSNQRILDRDALQSRMLSLSSLKVK